MGSEGLKYRKVRETVRIFMKGVFAAVMLVIAAPGCRDVRDSDWKGS